MKTKAIVSSIILIAATILFVLGSCGLDIWFYGACIVVIIASLLAFARQNAEYTKLKDKQK